MLKGVIHLPNTIFFHCPPQRLYLAPHESFTISRPSHFPTIENNPQGCITMLSVLFHSHLSLPHSISLTHSVIHTYQNSYRSTPKWLHFWFAQMYTCPHVFLYLRMWICVLKSNSIFKIFTSVITMKIHFSPWSHFELLFSSLSVLFGNSDFLKYHFNFKI